MTNIDWTTLDSVHAKYKAAESEILLEDTTNGQAEDLARRMIGLRNGLCSKLLEQYPAIRERVKWLERNLALAEKALEVKEQLNETLRRVADEAKRKAKAFDGFIASITKEPTPEEIEAIEACAIESRKAKAFDLIASKTVYAVMCGDKWAAKRKGASGLSSLDTDLLTAIEAATKEATP